MRAIKATRFLMQDRSNASPRTNANDILLQAEYNANAIASFQGEVLVKFSDPASRRSRTDDELLHSRDINQEFAEGIMPKRKYIRAFGRFRSPAYNEDYAH